MRGPRHILVAGLGYGDEGKGTITDWLCSPAQAEPARLVVRYNGGPQAGHNVVTPDGRHHTFSQFGSGTLQGAATHLSQYMMVDPLALTAEAEHLQQLGIVNPYRSLTVDERALIVTPYHAAMNQWRERIRGDRRHGSCGKGIGETAWMAENYPWTALRAAHCLQGHDFLRGWLTRLREQFENRCPDLGDIPEPEELADAYAAFGENITITVRDYIRYQLRNVRAVFEGAQGVLLDQVYGYHPHTTWSSTTFSNAYAILNEAGVYSGDALHLGVTRAYATRHGAGPFATEDPALGLPEPHNPPGEWQGRLRQGHLDLPALRYAIRVLGEVNAIAMTHWDTAAAHPELKACTEYKLDGEVYADLDFRGAPGLAWREREGQRLARVLPDCAPVEWGDPDRANAALSLALGCPLGIVSHGPTWRDKESYLDSAGRARRLRAREASGQPGIATAFPASGS